MRAMPSPTSMTVPTSVTLTFCSKVRDFLLQNAGDFRDVDGHSISPDVEDLCLLNSSARSCAVKKLIFHRCPWAALIPACVPALLIPCYLVRQQEASPASP